MHHFMANLSDYPMSCSAQPVDRVGDKLGGPDVGLVFLQATPGGSPATPIPTFRLREKPFRPRPRTGNYVALGTGSRGLVLPLGIVAQRFPDLMLNRGWKSQYTGALLLCCVKWSGYWSTPRLG